MIRIGTVGTGFIVDTFYDAVSRVPDMKIAAVYSRDAGKAAAYAEKYGAQKHYDDRHAFLADESLDFIYVASPNSLHYAWTRDALLAGRNVICEKPFVSTLAELEELVGLAKDRGLFLFEAITVPHLPNFRLLRQRLPELGSLKLVQCNFSQYSSRYQAFLDGKDPNVFNPRFSGGALMDINYYNLAFLVNLFGEPREIRYFPNLAENGIDTSGVLVLGYDGFVCSAVGAKDSKSENLVLLQGNKGYIRVPQESSRCLSFDLHTAAGEEQVNRQPDENALFYELADFAEIYRAGDLARRDELLETSLLVTRLCEKARKEAGILFDADRV